MSHGTSPGEIRLERSRARTDGGSQESWCGTGIGSRSRRELRATGDEGPDTHRFEPRTRGRSCMLVTVA